MDKNIHPITDGADAQKENRALSKIKAVWYKLTHSKHSYLFYCFLLPLCLMRLIYIAVGVFPGLDGSVLVLDLNGQYVYFYEALRDFIYGDASLLYSFSRALGGEFIGIYAYYVASPLAWIVALFPKRRMLEALLLIFLLKTGLCGLSFGFYIHKTSSKINRLSVVGVSTIYALCSYAIIQQHNSMWIDALIWLPIITYSIEELIKKGRWKLFVISLSLMVMSHYYIGYMVCIYVALYFFYYYLAHKENNCAGEGSHFFKSLLRVTLASAFALGIAAFMLIGAYYSLGFGKSTFSSPDWSFKVRYDLADLFAKFFPGTYDTVRPAGLPTVFSGTLTLLLLPFYYFSKRVSLREKVFSTIFLSIFVVSFMLNPVDIFWHGFQVPNWLNYRYSFMVTFLLLVMLYKALLEIRRQSSKTVFAVGAFLILAVAVLEKFEFSNFVLGENDTYVVGKIDSYRTVWFTIAIVIAYCAIIYALTRAKKLKDIKKASNLLLIVICVEMLLNGIINITALNCDVSFSSYSSYNDFFDKIEPVVSEIQNNDKSFYRMEKTHHRKTNDNMTLGMRGLSGSTSTLNKETIKFLNNMGYSSKAHWSKYLGGNPVNDSLLGIKYIIVQKNQPSSYSTYNENQAINALMDELYTVVAEDDNYIAYQNPYALSLAYQTSENVKSLRLNEYTDKGELKALYTSPFERLNKTVSAMLGEEIKIFVPIGIDSTTQSNVRKSTIAGHTKYAVTTAGTTAYVTMSAIVPQNAHVFFYATSEYPRETKIEIDGKKFGDFMANESNRIKSIGKYTANQKVTVKLTLSSDNLYLKDGEAYFYYLDTTALSKAMSRLSENQFQITNFSDDRFDGTITTSINSATIQTTIPYDEGWKIYVDGKETDIYKTFDALIAFDIQGSGQHTLKLVYSPTPVIIGFAVSAVSVTAFAAICLFEYNRKKKRKIINQSV